MTDFNVSTRLKNRVAIMILKLRVVAIEALLMEREMKRVIIVTAEKSLIINSLLEALPRSRGDGAG